MKINSRYVALECVTPESTTQSLTYSSRQPSS